MTPLSRLVTLVRECPYPDDGRIVLWILAQPDSPSADYISENLDAAKAVARETQIEQRRAA